MARTSPGRSPATTSSSSNRTRAAPARPAEPPPQAVPVAPPPQDEPEPGFAWGEMSADPAPESDEPADEPRRPERTTPPARTPKQSGLRLFVLFCGFAAAVLCGALG